MEDSQNQRRLILQQFVGTGAMPWLSFGPEYRPMKGRFGKRLKDAVKKEVLQQKQVESVQSDNESRASETAHPPTPSEGLPPAAPTSAFHRQLVGLLQKKLKRASFRKSGKMGNRGSNSSAPSPDKKPPDPAEVKSKNASQPAKERTKHAKNIPIDKKDVKSEFWPTNSSTSFSPKGSIVESESGDSLVSSCSQESNKVPDVRIESTSSPDTSSISSSLFVDVQDKFYTAEDQAVIGERLSLPDEDVDAPVFSPLSSDVPYILPQTELEPPSEPLDDDEDDDDCSYHDTQEDATDSSEHSPLKTYSPERRLGTRSCPGTPDTHHASESNLFCQYRERKGSLGSMGRSTLPTIGSVPRLDFRDEDDILPEEDELRNFTGSTQSLSVHRFQAPHRHRFRNSSCSSGRRDRSSSELCLHAKPAAVPQMIRRYCSQNLLVPNGECCLRRVASLTLDKATIEKHVERPKYLPEELDFSVYEKFQGQMLVNWFSSAFPEDHPLSRHELRLMAAQFCTNLLCAGVLKHIDPDNTEKLFRMGHFNIMAGVIFGLHANFLDIWPTSISHQRRVCSEILIPSNYHSVSKR